MSNGVEHPLSAEHLIDREVVLASHGAFYATDRRIIRYEAKGDRERVEAIPYDQLDGIVRIVAPRVQTVVLGALVVLLALLVGPEGVAQVIFTSLGVAGMLAGFLNRRTYVEFRSAALDTSTQRHWRVADRGSEDLQGLMTVVLSPEVPATAPFRPARRGLGIRSTARPALRAPGARRPARCRPRSDRRSTGCRLPGPVRPGAFLEARPGSSARLGRGHGRVEVL